MNQNKNENKLNKAGKTILYTFILMVVMGILSDGNGSIIGVMAVIFIAVGVAALVIYFVKQANKPKEEASATRATPPMRAASPGSMTRRRFRTGMTGAAGSSWTASCATALSTSGNTPYCGPSTSANSANEKNR